MVKLRPVQNVAAIGKTVILIAAIAIVIMVLWNRFGGCGGGGLDFRGGGNFTQVPKELQINYVPADFKSSLEEEQVLKVLSNPVAYEKEYNRMIYTLNMDLLNHVASRMNLPDTTMLQIESEYRKHHTYLRNLYLQDILELSDTTAANYEQWYAARSANAVDALNEVASKYTCFLVNHVISSLLNTNQGRLSVKGKNVETPCGVAMTEGLRPLVTRLQKRAAIDDFSRSKGMMEERVEKVIAELATMEVRDKKALSKELKTKIWGYSVSSTEIEISAISIMKVGFKLDKSFELVTDNNKQEVIIYLPPPEILSHEVFPKIDKLSVGWLREVGEGDFNENFNVLRREFRKDAKSNNVYEKAKQQADELMKTMLEPAIKGINKNYKVRVQFRSRPMNDLDPDLLEG